MKKREFATEREKKREIYRTLFFTIPISFLAGATNGILGAGGGILLILMLSRLLKEREDGQKEAFAISCTAVLSFSMMSAMVYRLRGVFSLEDALPYLLPALVGGIAGALLLRRIEIKWLKKLFALLLIYGGIRMIL